MAPCLVAAQPWGGSQIHQGNPERKRERAPSGTKRQARIERAVQEIKGIKVKRAELELNGSMRTGHRSTDSGRWKGPPGEEGYSLPGWGGAGLPPFHPPGRECPNPTIAAPRCLPCPPSQPSALPSPVQLEGWSPLGLGHPRPGSPSGLLVVRGGGGRVPEGPQHSDPGWGQVCQGLLALLLPQGTLLPRGPAPLLAAVPADAQKKRGSHTLRKPPTWASSAGHPQTPSGTRNILQQRNQPLTGP